MIWYTAISITVALFVSALWVMAIIKYAGYIFGNSQDDDAADTILLASVLLAICWGAVIVVRYYYY